MPSILDHCEPCKSHNTPDHRHQQTDEHGNTMVTYTIRNRTYTHLTNAVRVLVRLYGATRSQAFEYIFNLPLKVN